MFQQPTGLPDLNRFFVHAYFFNECHQSFYFSCSFCEEYVFVVLRQLFLACWWNPFAETFWPVRTTHTRTGSAHQSPQKEENEYGPCTPKRESVEQFRIQRLCFAETKPQFQGTPKHHAVCIRFFGFHSGRRNRRNR